MDELEALRPVSLEALEERAELLRRVDSKYLVARAELAALVRELAGDHDVLEIDGRRRFAYRSVYFDTPELRTFRDHVRGVRPRFKLRTRSYLDSGLCLFEVKLKTADDETQKRQAEHPAGEPERLTGEARELVRETLGEAGVAAPEDLRPLLATEFDRFTLAAREGAARITVDTGLRLRRLTDGVACAMDASLALVETKSEDGASRADELLERDGFAPISMSKYRTGVDLLLEQEDSPETAAVRRAFGSEGESGRPG
jgi:VTC domain